MVPNHFAGFFDASSQAAGALIGLLFVVIALSPGKMVGPHADVASRRLAVSSFIGLVNAFFVSLLALIPGHHNLGIGAAVVSTFSLFHTLQLHLARAGTRHVVMFVASLLAYGAELAIAIAFIANPTDTDLINYLAFVLIGCFAVALNRAWLLLQSAAIGGASTSDAEPSGTVG